MKSFAFVSMNEYQRYTIFKNSKPEGIKTVNVHIMQDINSNIQFACLLGKYAFM